MATNPVSARFQLKRDTSDNWTNSDVKLQSGEPGWDFQKRILKIGNGNDLWDDLLAISGSSTGVSLSPLDIGFDAATPFTNDTAMNLISSWVSGTPALSNRTLVVDDITDLTDKINIYRNTSTTYPLSADGKYTISLSAGTFFIHGHNYQVTAYDGDNELSKKTITFNSINLNFTLGTPYIISRKSIGIPYTYSNSPRVEGLRIRLYTNQIENPLIDLTNQFIPRNYGGTTEDIILTLESGEYTGTTYAISISGSISSSTTITYTIPNITSYVFDKENNMNINVVMNNSTKVTLSATFNDSVINGANTLQAANSPYGTIALSSYPAYNDAFTIKATFADSSFITAAIPLVFKTKADITSILFPKVLASITNPPTCIVNLNFQNINASTWPSAGIGHALGDDRPSANLKIINITNDSDSSLTLISDSLTNGWSSTGTGNDTIYSFNGTITRTFTYGESYNFSILNSDLTSLTNEDNVIITGNFVDGQSITNKTPTIAGQTASISGLEWAGNIDYASLQTNIYAYISGANPAYTSSLGSGTYDTTNANMSLSLNTGTTFAIGSTYVVGITHPSEGEYISLPSASYSETYITKASFTKSSVSLNITWLEDDIQLRLYQSNDQGTTGSQLNSSASSTTRPVSVASGGTSAVTFSPGTPFTAFTYGSYYKVGVKFVTTSNSEYFTDPFQYTFTATISAGPSFSNTDPKSLSFTFSQSGTSGEDRISVSLYAITPASASGATTSISKPSTGWIGSSYSPSLVESKQITFSGNTPQPVLLNSDLIRSNFYFIELKTPNSSGTSLAFSTSANKYDPSTLSLNLTPSSAFNTNPNDSKTNVTMSVLGPTTGATYYLKLHKNASGFPVQNTTDGFSSSTLSGSSYSTALPNTLPNTFVTYKFPIEKLNDATPTEYYLTAGLNVGSTSITARYPSANSTYFRYTYDSTIYTSNPITFDLSNDNTKATLTIPWKGYPVRAYPYLMSGTTTLALSRRFESVDLPYSATTTTISLTNELIYNSGFTASFGIAAGTTYTFGVWLNTPSSSESLPLSTAVQYNPTQVTIASIDTIIQNSIICRFTWSQENTGVRGSAGATPFAIRIANPAGGTNLYSSNIYYGDASLTINYATGWTPNTTYTVSIDQVGGRADATRPFTYVLTSLVSKTAVFQDFTTGSYQLGRLNVGGSIASGYDIVSVSLTLKEYTSSADTTATNKGAVKSFSLTISNDAGTAFSGMIWTQENFVIGYYYNVSCEIKTMVGSTLMNATNMLTTNLQYNPGGYDILVFIGQSNMCGRDDLSTNPALLNGSERTLPPIQTASEKSTALVSSGGRNVHMSNNANGSIITTTNATHFDSGHETGKPVGLSQAYEFTKLYANDLTNTLRSVGVVFVPVGGTGFVTSGNNGWSSPGGNLWGNASNCINKYAETRLTNGATYSVNRVVAIVLHQGESDHGQTTWNDVVDTAIQNFISYNPTVCDISYTKFLCGNLELMTSAASIDRSSTASSGDQATLRRAFSVPNQIDGFPFLKTGSYLASTYSSLGLVSIDKDPLQPVTAALSSGCYNAPGGGIHFSARAERLLGLRAYNAYVRLVDSTPSSTTYPSIVLDSTTCVPPEGTRFYSQRNELSFTSTANNSAYYANPICYLISYITTSGPIRIYVTEYKSLESTSSATSSITYCVIPYHLSNATRCSYTEKSQVSLNLTDDTTTTSNNFTGNIYGAEYDFPGAQEAYVVPGLRTSAMADYTGTAAAITPKQLRLDMADLITAITPTSNANVWAFTNLKNSLIIQSVYNPNESHGASPFTGARSMRLTRGYYLPPIIGNKLLNLQTAVGGGADYSALLSISTINSSWIISPTAVGGGGGGSPILITNIATGGGATQGGYLVFAGCPYNATSATWVGPTATNRTITSFSSASIATATTLSITLSASKTIGVGVTVKITFSGGTLPGSVAASTLNGTYTTITGTSTTGTTVIVPIPSRTAGTITSAAGTVEIHPIISGIPLQVSGIPTQNDAPAGGYLVVGTPTTGTASDGLENHAFDTNFTNAWSYTVSGGMTYTRVMVGMDWAMFFSASKYFTRATSGIRTNRNSSQYYSLQFCGIAPEETSAGLDCPFNPSGPTLASITGLSTPMYYYMYSTGCGFILNARNVIATNTYRVYYYISTRSGRVPHNNVTDTGEALGLDFYLSNPLPVRVFTKPPIDAGSNTGIIETTADIGQDLHFGSGTENTSIVTTAGSQKYLTQSYLHPPSSPYWDGSWKQVSFRFRLSALTPIAGKIAVDGSYNYNNVYIQFGPLRTQHASGTPNPGQPEYINTSINIANISIVVDNYGLI